MSTFDEPTGILVGHADGLFGRLEVRDHEGSRSFWCGYMCQGAFRLEPATATGALPGPLPDAPYHLAWLIPAARHPRGSILMAGLGCGAGAVALATCLSDIRITVVEIDPAVISLAMAHFPALVDGVTSGRIEIVQQDIVEFVWLQRGDRWSMAMLDAFQSGSRNFYPPELLNALHGQCDEVWVNVLDMDDIEMEMAHACAEILADCSWITRTVLTVRDIGGEFTGNILVGTATLENHTHSELIPFAGIDHPAAQQARDLLIRMERQHRPWRPLREP